MKSGFYMTDNEGYPVYYEKICDTDFKTAFKMSNVEKLADY
jgi:hypothetical protein